MPLHKGSSKKVISKNIHEMVAAGHPQAQAVAAALHNAHYKEKGFYTHSTHASLQGQEESVKTSGDGFSDSSVPNKPTTDSFYHNVSNWKR